jgi:hypothetical protein
VFKTNTDQLYTFYLNSDNLTDDNMLIFEVPRILTQTNGTNFKMLLMIEENHNSGLQNTFQHNISDFSSELTTKNLDNDLSTLEEENANNDKVEISYAIQNGPPPNIVERFVTKEVQVKVKNSIYNGEALILNGILSDTNQLDSLIKPTLWGRLTDKGTLTINIKTLDENNKEILEPTNILGQELDSYVKYIKFDARQITGHVGELKKYLFFRHTTEDKGYELAYAPLEKLEPFHDLNEDGIKDADEPENLHDNLENHEGINYDYIVWIPSKVFEYPGQ